MFGFFFSESILKEKGEKKKNGRRGIDENKIEGWPFIPCSIQKKKKEKKIK